MSTRRALCVGIDDYPGPQSLNGCVTDARAWSSALRDVLGFAEGDVELLVDKSATGRNLLASMEEMLSITRRGDVAVVTISCLGSYVVNEHGSVMPAICPYDVEADWVELITLAALTASATAGSRITLILDAAFTGSATRTLLFDDGPFRAPDDRRVRFLSPALFGRPIAWTRWPSGDDLEWAAVVMRACRSSQYAYEAFIDGQHRGAFSYVATNLLRATGGELTTTQFLRRLQAPLDDLNFDQTPEALGRPSRRRLFS